jgi:hypothetical protein
MILKLARPLFACLLLLGVILAGCDGSDDTPEPPTSESAQLQVQSSLQQTSVWCWAATAEMVFRYYGLPNINQAGNFQCGIVAAWFGGACATDCTLCITSIGPMSNLQLLVNGYGQYVRSLGGSSRVLTSNLTFRALSRQEIAAEISDGRPIIVGIAPGGGFALPNASQHVAVVVGYDFSSGQQTVYIHDPFPFEYFPYNAYPNPYVRVGGVQLGIGRYAVTYDALVAQLGWANTIYGIR